MARNVNAPNFINLFLLLVLAAAASIGVIAIFGNVSIVWFLLVAVPLELIYLWLARNCVAERHMKKQITKFALKMQTQTMFTGTYLACFTMSGILMAGWLDNDEPDMFKGFSLYEVIFYIFFRAFELGLIASQTISIWRFHYFILTEKNFGEMATGGFKQKTISLSASRDVANNRLEYYLAQLKLPNAPLHSRYLVESKIKVMSSLHNGENHYELIFGNLPTKLCLFIKPIDSHSSELHVDCKFIGGVFKWGFFLNPIDAYSMLRYTETNLFQLLTSDLILTTSVNKQNELRLQAAETQLRILQAQIEPHFLFNTLANIRHLYRANVDVGEEMMDHLIRYLRSAMEDLRSDVSTVGKEIDLALHYLAIMKIRMGQRLDFSFIAPDGVTQLRFPPAMLISLVENAIKHGLHSKEDGKLTISALVEDGNIRVTVQDNGVGFSSVQGSGVGLSNIRQRLEAIYGNKAWLEVGALQSGGFIASISIPLPE